MWVGLGLALALCFLPGGGTESQGSSTRCNVPPEWWIGEQNPMLDSRGSVTVVALLQARKMICVRYSMFHFIPVRLEDLRLKLERDGLIVSFLVVNHQGQHSQLKYPQLREKVSTNIPVYQQDSKQPDVWTALNGRKDDFLIYDRCGRLVYHLGLPYSFLSFPYVEEAIRITYCESKCGNCSYLVGVYFILLFLGFFFF
uniref:Selenoprotein P n=1 Tax=Varanus komodoensis TaxID=61221 RepID=A0A8D2IJS8_VARKO